MGNPLAYCRIEYYTHLASFPGSTPHLFFAPCFSYCKRQKLGYRPVNEANTHSLPRFVDIEVSVSAVTTLAFRPDGRELAVATLDGQISFWDVNG